MAIPFNDIYIERERDLYVYISATVPAGHQGSVSKEKTGYQLPVADYQLPVADYLSSFKGPHGASPGITLDYSYGPHENIRLLFRLFFHIPFCPISVPKHPPKGGPKSVKNRKNR